MAIPVKPSTQSVFQNSVQARSRYQPGFNVPVGGYDPSVFDAGLLFSLGTTVEKIPDWSIYPAARDRLLRYYWKQEPIISGAIYSIAARLKALDYKLIGEDQLHEELALMFKQADFNGGLRQLIEKTVQDIMTQDNGAFWELVGPGNPDAELVGGVVEGINYLDPAQCYRTFDPDYPILYIDPINGSRHRIHATRVLMFSNMPQPNELARNVGVSHLSRVLLSVRLMHSIQQYRREKSSGQFERAIGYGTGITQGTLRKLLQMVQYEDETSGYTRYGKIPFFTSMNEITLNILDLASIPDGFDLMKETEVYVNTVALCFGVDTRELWPATQTGATKADASIQNMKSRGKGLADLITMLEDTINDYIVPEGVTFEFDFVDDEHDRDTADLRGVVTDYLTAIKNAGGIDSEQYKAMLIHEGVLDETILEENEAPEELMPDPQQQPFMQLPPGANPPNNMPMQETDPSANEQQAAANKSQLAYNAALIQTARDFWYGNLSFVGLVSDMDMVVRRYVKESVAEGAAEGGIRPGDFLPHELTQIEMWVNGEQNYVLGFAEYTRDSKAQDKDFDIILSRIDLWVNRYSLFYAKGLALANGDKKKKWKRGPTEDPCVDCIKMDGRVYRMSTLDKYEALPQSYTLTCTGLRCQCKLEDTDEPLTRGIPPKFGRT